MLVVNASNIQKDYEWVLSQNKEFNATIIDESNNYSLLAIQGPKAIDYCQNFTNVDLNSMKNFSHSISTFANCNNILLSKTGYTGSGGLEIYIPNEYVVDIWDYLFEFNKNKTLMPIGLAARDTLRIEMGYCLYGHELSDTISPIAARLAWCTDFNKLFVGDAYIKKDKAEGTAQTRVGFRMINRGIPRQGYSKNTTELNYENNYRYIRYADVLLMAAEANNLSGNDVKARDYLNRVRFRAYGNNSQDSSASGSALTQEIWDERRLEFAGEGHRFFDLVRTGQAADKISGFVEGKHEVFPIPQTEIDVSNLTQNPGY